MLTIRSYLGQYGGLRHMPPIYNGRRCDWVEFAASSTLKTEVCVHGVPETYGFALDLVLFFCACGSGLRGSRGDLTPTSTAIPDETELGVVILHRPWVASAQGNWT